MTGTTSAAAMAPLFPFALFLAVLPFPGTVALRLLCLVAMIAIAAHSFWKRRDDRPQIPCKPALIAWIAVCGAAVVYSAIPAYSLSEFKNEIGYTMLTFLSFLVMARNRETVERLLMALTAGFLVIGLWAAGAWLAHGFSWDESGRYGGVAVFASYIVTAVPAFFWLAGTAIRPAAHRLAWAVLALAFVLALLTLQRAVWPALAAEAAVVAVWHYWHHRRSRHEAMRLALAAVAIMAAFLTASALRSGERAVAADLEQDSRLSAWHGIAEKIAEHPVVGAGFGRGTMGRVYPELIPKTNTLISHPHNVFLNYAIGMGLPGLAALAALFFCIGREFWRLARQEREDLTRLGVCGLMLVIGVLVRNQFNDTFIRDMALLFWALAGIFLGCASRISRHTERPA